MGKDVKTLFELVDVLFFPVRGVVSAGRHAEDWVIRQVAQRLCGVPPNDIVTPPLRVAGPAIEGLRFVVDDDPVLAGLYAGFLARAMQRELQGDAHPAFVECISKWHQTRLS